GMAWESAESRRVNMQQVEYASTVVPADTAVSVRVDNVPAWRAMVSWPGMAVAVIGVVLLLAGTRLVGNVIGINDRAFRVRPSVVRGFGCGLFVFGVLSQRLGAPIFFLLVAGVLFFFGIVPALWRGWQGIAEWRRGRAEAAASAAGGAMMLMLLLTGLAFGPGASEAQAKQVAVFEMVIPEGAKAAQALVQRWELRDGRLFAEAEFTVRGGAGDSFLLLRSPAVLTEFFGEGL